MWGVPEIRGKVPENFRHCSKLNDISCQGCLVYVLQIQVKIRISAHPFPRTCCYGNTRVVHAGQICVIYKLKTSVKQKLSQRKSIPRQNFNACYERMMFVKYVGIKCICDLLWMTSARTLHVRFCELNVSQTLMQYDIV